MSLRASLAAASTLAALATAAACGSSNPACGTPTGTACDGTTLYVCTDQQTGHADCADSGRACGFGGRDTGFTCVADACDGIGPAGMCLDNQLWTCADGEVEVHDCSDDAPCQYVNDATGYACASGGPSNAATVSGEVRYEDKPQLGDGDLGAIQTLPARGVTVVAIEEGSNAVLNTALTSDSGDYVLRVPVGKTVHVTAIAQSKLTTRPVTVMFGNGTVHGFASSTFAVSGDVVTDVKVTEASGSAEAFNVFDQMVHTMDAITGVLGDPTPTALSAIWSRGSSDGTYYSGHTLHLLGRSSDDDGYDDTVILHETGHFVEDTEGRSSSNGGGHDGTPVDPPLAWSEGFSTYWAQAVEGQPIYSDSNADGGFADDLDHDATMAQASGGMGQDVSENMVGQILWDLGDEGITDDDMVTDVGHAAVMQLQPTYLKTAQLRSVGAFGVDLVDALDGWFVQQGLGSCAGVREIVTGRRKFPYDFAGPGGTCP